MSTGRSKWLVIPAALATALVLLASVVRNHRVDASPVSVALALPQQDAAILADIDVELQPDELEWLGAQSPPDASGSPAAATDLALNSPAAVVMASTTPATVRKVIVGKGKRVVRQVPVTPKPTVQADPPTRTARFDMSQGGKRMTADEFDAWMKAQGIRVATGAPRPATPPSAPAATAPAPVACTPEPGKSC